MKTIGYWLALTLMMSATAAFAADMRSNNTSPDSKYYCVKNSESGACEDCVSKGDPEHKSSTCSELKNSTNHPLVRNGRCSDRNNRAFCKTPVHR